MYEKSFIISECINLAKIIIENNMKKYDLLMTVIEQFIIDNDIIVKENNKYFFNLYTTDMYNLPKQLTNLLYKTDLILAKYVTLVTRIAKYHSRISINNIIFIHFTYINKEIRNNLISYKCPSNYISEELECFGPEIQLINLYADLVNPSLVSKWSDLIKQEQKYSPEITQVRIEGGKESNIDVLLNNYISKHHVLIGQLGIQLITNNKKNIYGRLQIITDQSFDQEINNIRKLFPSMNYIIIHLKVPTNLNLYKLTVFINKYPLIDIFDAGRYEAVSYNNLSIDNIDIQLGSPFVIKRFILIELWSVMYAIKNGQKISNDIINKLLTDYKKVPDFKPNILFPKTYIGYIEDPLLKKERLTQKLKTHFIPPYMPYLKDSN
jgi:hypothetical protein